MRTNFFLGRLFASATAVCALAALSGCGSDSPPRPALDAARGDAGPSDAAMRDAGSMRDAGTMGIDAGTMGMDAGPMAADAGPMGTDAGPASDGGPSDRCVGVDCSSLDTPCQVGTCVPATGACRAMNRPDGTTCSRLRCIPGGSCMTGTCVGGTPMDCSALTDRCHVGSCNPATGVCGASPIALDCHAFDAQCVVGACDVATGACAAMNRPDGTVCDDGVTCSMGTMCMAGACLGGVVMASPGDVCAAPVTLLGTPGTQMVTGDTRCANDDRATSCGTGGAADVFYTFTLPDTRELVAETISPTAFDTVLELRSATCGTGAVIACDNDSGASITGGRLSRISTTLGPGTYFLAVDGVSPGAIGAYTLRFSLDAQDTCTAPPTIAAPPPATTLTLTGSTALATADYMGTCGAVGSAPDHVYALSVSTTGPFVFETHTTASSDFDTVLYVRRSPCATGVELGCNDNGGADPSKSRLALTLDPGTYYVFVDGASGASGSYRLDISRLCLAGETMCGVGSCANLNRDRNNCGVCGRMCPGMQVCIAGACATAPLYHGWTSPLAGCSTAGYDTTLPTNLGGTYPVNTGDSNACRAWKLAATVCTTEPTMYSDTNNWTCPVSGGFTDPVFGAYCTPTGGGAQYSCSTCPGACNAMCVYNPLSLRNCMGREADQP